jgi:hypothetical protein
MCERPWPNHGKMMKVGSDNTITGFAAILRLPVIARSLSESGHPAGGPPPLSEGDGSPNHQPDEGQADG